MGSPAEDLGPPVAVRLALGPFGQEDQLAFAALSRDANPVHLDARAARRTLFGQPIVHGMHLVLAAMEAIAVAFPGGAHARLSARFNRPVFLGERLDLEVVKREDGGVDAAVLSDGALLASLSLAEPRAAMDDADWDPQADRCRPVAATLPIDLMRGAGGSVALPQKPEEIRARFPHAARLYGANRIAHLLGITYVIGMEVPGLHSMFATLSVALREGVDTHLGFSAKRVTPKISHVQLQFDSAALSGTAEAFVRPVAAPIRFDQCSEAVRPGEFSGRKALVVGGSRGLGLLTGYLLAAGGAELVLSYRHGEAEARQALEVLTAQGISASAVRIDAADPADAFAELRAAGQALTDLYYFATPHIFVRKKKLFEPDLLAGFTRGYTADFLAVVEEAKTLAAGPLAVFYPSSDALNTPLRDLAEYYVAKAAGEALCEMLNRYDDRVKVLVSRLPRLPTDQTATLMPVETADPIGTMLGICRAMGGLHA